MPVRTMPTVAARGDWHIAAAHLPVSAGHFDHQRRGRAGSAYDVMDSDILVIATPLWLGQLSSVANMVLERLDSELSQPEQQGRLLTYGTPYPPQ